MRSLPASPPPACRCSRPERARGRAAAAVSSSRDACIVIGGGVGGCVAAAKLAQLGHRVTLLEQNDSVGGRCQSLTLGGCRFDTGPSLLLFPEVYRDTFSWLGAKLEDHVQLQRVQPAAYRVFFADGYADGSSSSSGSKCHLDLLYDVQAMVQQLEQLEPGAGTQYLAWLADARAALDVGMREFIARDFDGPLGGLFDFLDLRRLLPLLGKVSIPELLGNHHARLARRFKSPRICALLSFQDLYVGLSPYTAPGVFSLLAATELTDGVWYPQGGFGRVRDGLAAVMQQHGVDVQTRARVRSILTRGRAVTGVALEDGRVLQAPLVLSNRDVAATYGLLDGAPPDLQQRRQELVAKQYSAGVIAYNWVLGSKQLPGLLHHNVFLSDEYEASWRRARSAAELRRYPNFYVHAPARTDASAAPPGKDSLMVLLPVAHMGETPTHHADYGALVDAGRERVLASMQAAGVDVAWSDIVEERVTQPAQWADAYGLQHGAAFGLAHGLDQLALLRPGAKVDGLNGLVLVGASARPGNGVPLVMLGARQAVERIERDRTRNV